MIRVYVLGFGGLRFRVLILWFKVYNTLVNAFNKHLNKMYKTLFKML